MIDDKFGSDDVSFNDNVTRIFEWNTEQCTTKILKDVNVPCNEIENVAKQ